MIVLLAEMVVWHSRASVPTRRVALGADELPVEPTPGFGGLLLAGMVATFSVTFDDDYRTMLFDLMRDLEAGNRISQPRLRYRLQEDRVGLTRTTHRLLGGGEGELILRLQPATRHEPQVLAAIYRAGEYPLSIRRSLFTLLRSATRWRGGSSTDLLSYLTGHGPRSSNFVDSLVDPNLWALDVLGLDEYNGDKRALQRHVRRLLRRAHPDHGGAHHSAGTRIADLTAARNILLANPPVGPSARNSAASDPDADDPADDDPATHDPAASDEPTRG